MAPPTCTVVAPYLAQEHTDMGRVKINFLLTYIHILGEQQLTRVYNDPCYAKFYTFYNLNRERNDNSESQNSQDMKLKIHHSYA